MKKILIIVMVVAMTFAFCSCGSDEAAEPTAYSPTDIQVDDADGVPLFYVIYDIDNHDTEQWHGYDTYENEVQTAIDGIKACMAMDEWADNAIVFGYAQEPELKYIMYAYGNDDDYTHINLHQLGIYNDSYDLQGELDQ